MSSTLEQKIEAAIAAVGAATSAAQPRGAPRSRGAGEVDVAGAQGVPSTVGSGGAGHVDEADSSPGALGLQPAVSLSPASMTETSEESLPTSLDDDDEDVAAAPPATGVGRHAFPVAPHGALPLHGGGAGSLQHPPAAASARLTDRLVDDGELLLSGPEAVLSPSSAGRAQGVAGASAEVTTGRASNPAPRRGGRIVKPGQDSQSMPSSTALVARAGTKVTPGRRRKPLAPKKVTQVVAPAVADKGTHNTDLRRALSISRRAGKVIPDAPPPASDWGGWDFNGPARPPSPRRAREAERRAESAIVAMQAQARKQQRLTGQSLESSVNRLYSGSRASSARRSPAKPAEEAELTFSPRITARARALGRRRVAQEGSPGRAQSVDTAASQRRRAEALHAEAARSKARRAARAAALQKEQCTFQPVLSARSQRLARAKSAEPQQRGGSIAAGQRLFESATRQQARLAAERAAKEAHPPGATFSPRLNRPRSASRGSTGTPAARRPLYDAEGLAAAEAKLAALRQQLATQGCTFSPSTNHNSKFKDRGRVAVPRQRSLSSTGHSRSSSASRREPGDLPVGERLYEAAKAKAAHLAAKVEAKREAEERSTPFTPQVDKRSAVLARRHRARQSHSIAAALEGSALAPRAQLVTNPGDTSRQPITVVQGCGDQEGAAGEKAQPDGVVLHIPDGGVSLGSGATVVAASGHLEQKSATSDADSRAAPPPAQLSKSAATAHRLYAEAWVVAAKRTEAQAAAQEAEEAQCTFQPRTLASSAKLVSGRSEDGQAVWQRLHRQKPNHDEAMRQAAAAREAAEEAQCTFQPQLPPTSFARRVHGDTKAVAGNVVERLYTPVKASPPPPKPRSAASPETFDRLHRGQRWQSSDHSARSMHERSPRGRAAPILDQPSPSVGHPRSSLAFHSNPASPTRRAKHRTARPAANPPPPPSTKLEDGVGEQGSVQGEGGVPEQGSVQGEDGVPEQGSVQGEGGVGEQGSVQGEDGVPEQGSVQGEGGVPEQGSVQGEDGVPEQGSVQGEGGVPEQGSVQGEDGVPEQGSVQGEGGVGEQGSVQGEDGVPEQGSVQGEGGVGEQGSVQGEDGVPEQGSVQGEDGAASDDSSSVLSAASSSSAGSMTADMLDRIAAALNPEAHAPSSEPAVFETQATAAEAEAAGPISSDASFAKAPSAVDEEPRAADSATEGTLLASGAALGEPSSTSQPDREPSPVHGRESSQESIEDFAVLDGAK